PATSDLTLDQTIEIYGRKVARFEPRLEHNTFMVPFQALPNDFLGKIAIHFFNETWSPLKQGLNDDKRDLGLYFFWFTIASLDRLPADAFGDTPVLAPELKQLAPAPQQCETRDRTLLLTAPEATLRLPLAAPNLPG